MNVRAGRGVVVDDDGAIVLTGQQARVLELAATGLPYWAIGQRLHYSRAGVGRIMQGIMLKTNARTRAQVLAAARERGWIA